MLRKSLIIIIVFLFAFTFGNAQKVASVDFDEVKKQTLDVSAKTYYPNLLKRYKEFDTTLTENDFYLIYYGIAFQEYYYPYGLSEEKPFLDAYYNEKYSEATELGLKILEKDPINIKILFKMLVSYHTLGNLDLASKYSFVYGGLMKEIYSSGDGSSLESPFVVMKISDEYEILAANNLKSSGQALVGVTDVLTVKSKEADKPFELDKLYFNVSKPLETMSKQFGK